MTINSAAIKNIVNSSENDPDSLSVLSLAERWSDIIRLIKEEYLSEVQAYPWIVGFSGGKDSTVVAHAVFEALLSIPPSKRKRPIHIVSNDTMVESPLVIAHLNEVASQIQNAAGSMGLPIVVARTTPDVNQTFWVLLIGKGYPWPAPGSAYTRLS